MTALIHEPEAGRSLVGGFADGMVKLYDLRSSMRQSSLAWSTNGGVDGTEGPRSVVREIGIRLGEGKYVASSW